MKKLIIDGKEYWVQEDCDIPKIPMPISKDILKNNQPERSKREDWEYCIVCETNSREPEEGSGHYCHKCKEYDYA